MVAIVDANNFYCSCERVFNPLLRGKPVVVLSNNDGCVIARSEEAKNLGIEMGLPEFQGRDFFKKNNVYVFSSNYTLYGDLSARIMKILQEYSPSVEVYSIDESFLDFSGMENFNLSGYADQIRSRVLQEVGIPVSIGISATKTLAKMANRFAKKERRQEGVHIAGDEISIAEILRYTKVKDIWGIGGQYSKLLERNGIKTAFEFSELDDRWVEKHMTVTGLRTLNELRGLACVPLELVAPIKKGMCSSKSFGSSQTSYVAVQEALANYTARIGEKLRASSLRASSLTVFCHTNPFNKSEKPYWGEKSVQLVPATNATMELVHFACLALKSIFKEGYAYKKVGILAHGLQSGNLSQQVLFDPVDHEKNDRAIKAMDELNQRFGKGKVNLAIQGKDKAWKMKQNHLSQSFSTNIDSILKIKD